MRLRAFLLVPKYTISAWARMKFKSILESGDSVHRFLRDCMMAKV